MIDSFYDIVQWYNNSDSVDPWKHHKVGKPYGNDLFELNEALIAQLQATEGLPPQLRLETEALKKAVGAPITPLKKSLPFAYRLQQTLFGQWDEIDDGTVRCPHCGSTVVARKEKARRSKRYRDPQTREWRQVEGYRYYCLNPSCCCGTFTNYPPGVRLYSHWTVDPASAAGQGLSATSDRHRYEPGLR